MIEDPQAVPIIKAVNLGMAESHNITLAINVNRGMRSNSKQCKSNRSLPFGYTSDKKQNIYSDPKEAPFVTHAFKSFVNGASYKQIADYFNSNGLKTRYGHSWSGVCRFSDIVIEDGMPALIDKNSFLMAHDKMKNYSRKKEH